MKPVSLITSREAKLLEGLFFDLDDTLLEGGVLSEKAYSTLFRLGESGLRLVALTGRSAEWASLIARMWPIEAAIAENGALFYAREANRVDEFDPLSEDERKTRCQRLQVLVNELGGREGALRPTDDARGRISDFTFDIGEHECVAEEVIDRVRDFARAAGAKTTCSSIHLHITFDRADKATGALNYLRLRGMDPTVGRRRFAFVGDSENDAPAFAAFALSVGVRNLKGSFSLLPRFITKEKTSDGFYELAQKLISLREEKTNKQAELMSAAALSAS